MVKTTSLLDPIFKKIKSSKFFIFQYLFVLFLVVAFLFAGWNSNSKPKSLTEQSKSTTITKPTIKVGMVNINNSTSEELDTLIGIGPVTAQKIIDNRTYESIDELVDKNIISKTLFEKIRSKITI